MEKLSKLFSVITNDYAKSSRCMIYSSTVFYDLLEKGITPRKSLKDNTKVFDFIPKELLHHFIRGWFDGDGSIGFYPNQKVNYHFNITGTKNILIKILFILKHEANIKTRSRVNSCRNVKRIQIGGKQVVKIGLWLYKDATVYLERKKDIFNKILEF